ncbi:hypothetical protein EIH07_01315 [Chryseobacterium taklimakanense]|uniref:hypothetical protein n=1 Tax=Chryseobacterium taklimakanense TaxID=536441 RepID=UPI000F5EB6C6|nr:hypothetical protein [Chryseobacterium taklimakanense]AZI21775.1 hypothetical protein EIH07_01315 [Chryseobacterium taklimakanense]
MKRLFLAAAVAASTVFGFAQTKYETAMTEKVAKIEQHLKTDEIQTLSNDFTRIGNAEKTQWLPYYYAAFAQIQKGRILMREQKLSELDAVASEAQKSLDKAMELSKDIAELFILQKMIHNLKMMVNPMERYMTEGALGAENLAKAEKLDPANPRITLLKAEDSYFTPEQFGGSKSQGLELFRKALEQFKIYKTGSPLHPNWGKAEAEYFLAQKP